MKTTLTLSALLLASLAALHAAETLYNGIVLPDVWPPQDLKPESMDEVMPVPYLEHPPAVIPMDVGRQFFVDDFLIASTDLQRTYYRAEKYAGNPVFKPETKEELKLRAWVYTGNGGIFFDPAEQVFKMFYTAGWCGGLALATSTDMIHWTRPDLGMAGGNLILPAGMEWTGKPILETAGSGNCVWLDLQPANPAERLKLMTVWTDNRVEPPGLYHTLQTSADGRVWSPEVRTSVALHDYCSFFHNPFRNVWVFSIRYNVRFNNNAQRERRRKYYESKEFLSLADCANAVYWTGGDRLDAPEPAGRYPGAGDAPQLYSLNALAYESLMIGMHYIHRGPKNAVAGRAKVPKLIDLELGFSRDGFHWQRPDRRGFIAGTRRDGDWDRGYLLGAAGVFVVLGDKLVFPYTGCAGIGPDGSRGIYTGGSIGLAMLRRDGFASMDAGKKPGTLTTRPVTFKGRHLFVNANCPQGELRVELLNEANQVLASSKPVSVDTTKRSITWQDAPNLSKWAGKPVGFRFHLTNGKLYAFWVSPVESGASNGYVGAGGPDYNGVMDTAVPPRK